MLELAQEIANLRENKDVGKNEVDQYVTILDNLLLYYKELAIAVEDL